MGVHPRAYVCIVKEKTKHKFPRENHVVLIGKQNIQAKNVYWPIHHFHIANNAPW